MMRLLAISDLHLGHAPNRAGLTDVADHPDDWLILAGDVGERIAHLELALETLAPRFAKLLWVPGNHDLWVAPGDDSGLRGEARYRALVDLCREYDALTPEDPYPLWPGEGPPTVIAPLMVLYDYTFRPDHIPVDAAVAWAAEAGVRCADERYLHPDPYESRSAWCAARATLTFSIWCGTRRTEDWHRRFDARVVVSGHLHIRTTRFRDGVRFEEVSLGYPRQWKRERGLAPYFREILPGHSAPVGDVVWR